MKTGRCLRVKIELQKLGLAPCGGKFLKNFFTLRIENEQTGESNHKQHENPKGKTTGEGENSLLYQRIIMNSAE